MGQYVGHIAAKALMVMHKEQGKPLTGADLVRKTHQQQSSTYTTLKVLREAGVIAFEKDTGVFRYTLKDDSFIRHTAFVAYEA